MMLAVVLLHAWMIAVCIAASQDVYVCTIWKIHSERDVGWVVRMGVPASHRFRLGAGGIFVFVGPKRRTSCGSVAVHHTGHSSLSRLCLARTSPAESIQVMVTRNWWASHTHLTTQHPTSRLFAECIIQQIFSNLCLRHQTDKHFSAIKMAVESLESGKTHRQYHRCRECWKGVL